MPAKLKRLLNQEISLVPKAANRRVFALTKGDGMALDEIKALEAIEALDKQGDGELLAALLTEDTAEMKALEKADGMTHDDYKKVRAAMKVMGPDLCKKFGQFSKVLAPDPEPDADDQDGEDTDSAKTAKKGRTNWMAAAEGEEPNRQGSKKATSQAEQERTAKAKGKKGAVVNDSDEVRKAAAEADELRERVTKAESELAAMREQREREVFIRKAADLVDHLPGATADDLGGILHKTSKTLDPKEQARLEKVLASANGLLRKSTLFNEIGTDAEGEGPQSAYGVILHKAAELQKSDPKLTPEQARAQIIKANPGLVQQMNEEQDARIRKGGR